jgi:hypothetical protein
MEAVAAAAPVERITIKTNSIVIAAANANVKRRRSMLRPLLMSTNVSRSFVSGWVLLSSFQRKRQKRSGSASGSMTKISLKAVTD